MAVDEAQASVRHIDTGTDWWSIWTQDFLIHPPNKLHTRWTNPSQPIGLCTGTRWDRGLGGGTRIHHDGWTRPAQWNWNSSESGWEIHEKHRYCTHISRLRRNHKRRNRKKQSERWSKKIGKCLEGAATHDKRIEPHSCCE